MLGSRQKRIGANRAQREALRRELLRGHATAAAKKSVKPLLVTCCALAAVVGALVGGRLAYNVAVKAPFFCVRGVTVTGNQVVESSRVIEAAALKNPQSLLALDGKGIRRRVLQLEWVGNALVRRKWNRTVEISITEEQPVAWVKLDSLYLVNEKGKLLRPVRGNVYDFSVISGMAPFTPKNRSVAGQPLWEKARSVITALKNLDREFSLVLSEILVKQNSLCLITITGTMILLPEDLLPKRIHDLSALTRTLIKEGRTARQIDLNYEHVAYVRY